MKKFITIIVALLAVQSASAWSKAIHAGIAAIANENLTEEAAKNIRQVLDGKSIIYYSHWMYDMEGSEGFKHTKSWKNIPMGSNNKPLKSKKAAAHENKAVQSAKALEALLTAAKAIESGTLSKEQTADNLRYIIMIVGDLHCPTHYIFTDLLEKRKSYYYYNDKKHNYMSYWESNSIRGTFDWRTNEYVHLLNRKSPEQIAQITAGSITDWVTGNAPLYRQVYGMLDTGTKFSKKSLRLWQNKIYPIATEQVAVAGYRLAALLNSLFDSNAANVKLK